MDRILNAKSEDVREILEEASGTLVYKARKLAASKKLENTRANLSRIEDIVTYVIDYSHTTSTKPSTHYSTRHNGKSTLFLLQFSITSPGEPPGEPEPYAVRPTYGNPHSPT